MFVRLSPTASAGIGRCGRRRLADCCSSAVTWTSSCRAGWSSVISTCGPYPTTRRTMGLSDSAECTRARSENLRLFETRSR